MDNGQLLVIHEPLFNQGQRLNGSTTIKGICNNSFFVMSKADSHWYYSTSLAALKASCAAGAPQ